MAVRSVEAKAEPGAGEPQPYAFGVSSFPSSVKFCLMPGATPAELAETVAFSFELVRHLLSDIQDEGDRARAPTLAFAADAIAALGEGAAIELGRRVDPTWNVA